MCSCILLMTLGRGVSGMDGRKGCPGGGIGAERD
jgi:hypothetical protein